MKTIGLLGGMSWVSTIEYYRRINTEVQARLGGHHCASIVLRSMDYAAIKQYDYQSWEKIGEVLRGEMLALNSCRVDCMLVCNNTLHKALDDIGPHLGIETPIFHIVDCVGACAQANNLKNLLLLGTRFTMEHGFYQARLKKYGAAVTVPDLAQRAEIQRIIQEELVKDNPAARSAAWLHEVIAQHPCDAVVAGCTELPLLLNQERCAVPVLDTLELHCARAVEFALG